MSTTNNQINKQGEVTLDLSVAPPLNGFLNTDPVREAVTSKLARELEGLLGVLGIPGKPVVQLHSVEQAGDRSLSISINGRLCAYSDTQLELILAYLWDDRHESDPATSAEERLQTLYNLWTRAPHRLGERLGDFFSLICLDAIKAKASVLLGPSQAAEYATRLLTMQLDAQQISTVLSPVLDLKISIADHSKVKQVLAQGLSEKKANEDIAEDLISALRSNVVEIQIPLNYLKEITRSRLASEWNKFSLMRDWLFSDFGLRFPSIRFVPVEDLRPDSFRFKINHVTTLPRRGLATDKCLANLTPEHSASLSIASMPLAHPLSGYTCSVIHSSLIGALDTADINYWPPLPYIFLCLGAELLSNGPALVYREAVAADLDQLELAFPALVNARPSVSIEQITRVLRCLIAERIPIRNLKFILERILDYDYVVADPSRYIVFDERLPAATAPSQAWVTAPANIAAFIRIGMKRLIKDKYAQDGTLLVYLVDHEIEKFLSDYGLRRYENADALLSGVEREKILQAVRATLGDPLTFDRSAVILTNTSTRPILRELIHDEFPDLPVLAYEENARDISIHRLSTISFNTLADRL